MNVNGHQRIIQTWERSIEGTSDHDDCIKWCMGWLADLNSIPENNLWTKGLKSIQEILFVEKFSYTPI